MSPRSWHKSHSPSNEARLPCNDPNRDAADSYRTDRRSLHHSSSPRVSPPHSIVKAWSMRARHHGSLLQHPPEKRVLSTPSSVARHRRRTQRLSSTIVIMNGWYRNQIGVYNFSNCLSQPCQGRRSVCCASEQSVTGSVHQHMVPAEYRIIQLFVKT